MRKNISSVVRRAHENVKYHGMVFEFIVMEIYRGLNLGFIGMKEYRGKIFGS